MGRVGLCVDVPCRFEAVFLVLTGPLSGYLQRPNLKFDFAETANQGAVNISVESCLDRAGIRFTLEGSLVLSFLSEQIGVISRFCAPESL